MPAAWVSTARTKSTFGAWPVRRRRRGSPLRRRPGRGGARASPACGRAAAVRADRLPGRAGGRSREAAATCASASVIAGPGAAGRGVVEQPSRQPSWPARAAAPLTTPSPAPITAYGSARALAATRAPSVEAASSWSASRTSAALSTSTLTGHAAPAGEGGPQPGGDRCRGVPSADREPGRRPRGGSPSASTMVAIAWRPAAATAGGSRFGRNGSAAAAQARAMRSRSAGGTSSAVESAGIAAMSTGSTPTARARRPSRPSQSSSATCSNVCSPASSATSWPRKRHPVRVDARSARSRSAG